MINLACLASLSPDAYHVLDIECGIGKRCFSSRSACMHVCILQCIYVHTYMHTYMQCIEVIVKANARRRWQAEYRKTDGRIMVIHTIGQGLILR